MSEDLEVASQQMWWKAGRKGRELMSTLHPTCQWEAPLNHCHDQLASSRARTSTPHDMARTVIFAALCSLNSWCFTRAPLRQQQPFVTLRWCRRQLHSYFWALLPRDVWEGLQTGTALVPPCDRCWLTGLFELLPAQAETSWDRYKMLQKMIVHPVQEIGDLLQRKVGKLSDWCWSLPPLVRSALWTSSHHIISFNNWVQRLLPGSVLCLLYSSTGAATAPAGTTHMCNPVAAGRQT